MKILIFSSLILMVSCASKVKEIPHQQRYVDTDGAEVIELPNPFQKNIMNAMSDNKKIAPHTVYDNSERIEAFKKSRETRLIEKFSGPYKFHEVKAKDSLSTIAKEIYGDRRKWSLIQSWNYDILPNENNLKKGMKLRYLPPAELAKIHAKKSNRLPASEK